MTVWCHHVYETAVRRKIYIALFSIIATNHFYILRLIVPKEERLRYYLRITMLSAFYNYVHYALLL